MPLSRNYAFLLLVFFLSSNVIAQTSEDTVPTTRAGEIQAERQEKAQNVQAPEPSAIGKQAARLADVVRVVPIRIVSEGLGTGHGFGIGAVFQWYKHDDQILWRLWGLEMRHNFYRAGAAMQFQNLTRQDLTFTLQGVRADAPQLDYYGPGPNSSVNNHTNYRLETTLFDLRGELRAHRHFVPGCHVGGLLLNVGPGTNNSLPSTETVFGPAAAPGIDTQSNYVVAGCSAQLDWRDLPDNPTKGTYLAGIYERYDAQQSGRFSFNRVSAQAEEYIPFFNRKRVIALLANTVLSWHNDNQVVPFYLQPTLGSDTELRGFPRYRFYDENSTAMTAEYRWEINTGMDMAMFFDTGQVFHRPGSFSLSEIESSAGFGFLFKQRSNVLARIDFGFSREGFQVWLKFGKLF
jgi:surface antigen Omp85-like protein